MVTLPGWILGGLWGTLPLVGDSVLTVRPSCSVGGSEGELPASHGMVSRSCPWGEPGLSYGCPIIRAGFPSRTYRTALETYHLCHPPGMQADSARDCAPLTVQSFPLVGSRQPGLTSVQAETVSEAARTTTPVLPVRARSDASGGRKRLAAVGAVGVGCPVTPTSSFQTITIAAISP